MLLKFLVEMQERKYERRLAYAIDISFRTGKTAAFDAGCIENRTTN